jgi:GDP-4-dehydro-6-deoxy-D-mannose reductase
MGVNGFVGHHLAHELHNNGHRVIGVGITEELSPKLEGIVEAYIQCDLADAKQVKQLPLENARAVINLAGLAHVGASFDNPDEYMRINVAVHTNVCEAVQAKGNTSTRVLAISTGAVYDNSSPMPHTESSPVTTSNSPYAVSKIKMEKQLKPYQDAGMDIVVARPFNHTGPGQEPAFLVPKLIKELRDAGHSDHTIYVGNLATKRDYTDVRDIVKAYRLLIEAPNLNHQLYNICSGTSRAGTEILEQLEKLMRLTGKITVQVDQTLIRAGDPMDIYGDNSRLKHDTGWQPKISFSQTLKDSL